MTQAVHLALYKAGRAGEDVVRGGRSGHGKCVVSRDDAAGGKCLPEGVCGFLWACVEQAPAGVEPQQFFGIQSSFTAWVAVGRIPDEVIKWVVVTAAPSMRRDFSMVCSGHAAAAPGGVALKLSPRAGTVQSQLLGLVLSSELMKK
jgi:hypothetical protein